jgi:hypothetical protein
MAKLKMKCFRSTNFLTVDFLYPLLILTASFQIFGNQLARKGALIMPKKKALDTGKLIEMVKAETSSAEIMKKMGFKTSTQLKAAYMSALIAEGKVPAIKGGRGAGKASKVKTVGVGKRGSIVIAKDLVESLGIGAGDKFTMRKTKLGIALKRAE